MELDKDFNLIIALRIREIREAFNMTRDQFSEMCDISTSFQSRSVQNPPEKRPDSRNAGGQ